MKKVALLSKLLIFVFLAFVCEKIFVQYEKSATEGFKPAKIYFPEQMQLVFTSAVNRKNTKWSKILNQKFFYLGKGRQCFAFESADGKYVVKFLRFDRIQYPLWARTFGLSGIQNKICSAKELKLDQWIESYTCAIEAENIDFKILGHNLDGKAIDKEIIVKDRYNREHRIYLPHTVYFLQEKAEILSDVLLSSRKDKQKEIIQKFLVGIFSRFKNKIINKTASCMENIGWIENAIIEFDIGDMHPKDLSKDPKEFKHQFILFTKPMQKFLQEKIPDLLEFFLEEQMKILSEF